MRFVLVLFAAMLALVLVAPQAQGFGGPLRTELAKGKKHKPKKKRCKKGQVKVKFGPKTRCLPLKAALPKPKAEDPRLAIIKEGLTPQIGHIPDPKNKIPPPMETVYRKLDPKAQRGMEKAVGIAVNRLDSLGQARARTSDNARASAESGNSFSTTIGGVTIDGRLTIAIDATGEIVGTAQLSETRDQGGGRTVKVTTEIPIRLKHQGFEVPECPTADGKVKGRDGLGITVRSEVRSNGGKNLDEYYIFEVVDETDPLTGTVADDAKLDDLEIKSIEEITEKAGGSIFGGSIVNASIVRNTVYHMRTNTYEPHVTLVNVGVVLSGILRIFTPLVRPQVSERLKRSADKGFAATVDFEVKEFRKLEEGWNTPNKCAKLIFDKARESLTLKLGQSGDENVRVEAKAGGSPAKAEWTVGGQENASLSLSDHSANPTSFHYQVTKAGKGIKVKGTFKATSKAGVAEDSWIQKTEEKETINHIEGTIAGKSSTETLAGPSVLSWSGTVSYDRFSPVVYGGASGLYLLTEGHVTVTASGIDGTFVSICQQSGNKELTIAPKNGSIFVLGTNPQEQPPYTYSISAIGPPETMQITRGSCPPEDKEWEGKEGTIGAGVELNVSEQESSDGLSYVGSEKKTQGMLTTEESWNLQGTP